MKGPEWYSQLVWDLVSHFQVGAASFSAPGCATSSCMGWWTQPWYLLLICPANPVIGIPKLSQEGCEAHHLFHLELPNQSFLGPEARSPSLLAATRLALVCLGNRSLTSVQASQEGGLTHNSLYTLKSVEEGAHHSVHGDSKI